VLDGIVDPGHLIKCFHAFPKPDNSWWKYDNILERKYAKNDLSDVDDCLSHLIYEMCANRFVAFLERITGIPGLIVDHNLNGGGFHQITKGGKLDIHADYNYHPITKLDRRLNILLYLNPGWDPKWNGQLELWDKNMTRCVRSIEPDFNRMVIFSTTDWALHGHPEPLACPEGITRKSIALYYYSNGRPDSEKSAVHSTVFKRRPQDPIIEEHEELRQKRAQRRLT
jgi:hypothetical protein